MYAPQTNNVLKLQLEFLVKSKTNHILINAFNLEQYFTQVILK